MDKEDTSTWIDQVLVFVIGIEIAVILYMWLFLLFRSIP